MCPDKSHVEICIIVGRLMTEKCDKYKLHNSKFNFVLNLSIIKIEKTVCQNCLKIKTLI